MRPIAHLLIAAACALAAQPVLTAPALAAPHATSVQSKALLDKAVAEIKAVGPEKAFAEFNDPKGRFKVRDLYVFVFDAKGVYEASGANPRLVGTNALDMTDAEGKPMVREMIEVAKTKRQGEVNYVWLNRVDNRVEHKRSLVEQVGDHLVGVGYYVG